jgi:hypothetical protein
MGPSVQRRSAYPTGITAHFWLAVAQKALINFQRWIKWLIKWRGGSADLRICGTAHIWQA